MLNLLGNIFNTKITGEIRFIFWLKFNSHKLPYEKATVHGTGNRSLSESSGPASPLNYLTISINGLNEYIAGRLPWAGVTMSII